MLKFGRFATSLLLSVAFIAPASVASVAQAEGNTPPPPDVSEFSTADLGCSALPPNSEVAPEAPATLSGKVFDGARNGIAEAMVLALFTGGNAGPVITCATAGSDGTFSGLPLLGPSIVIATPSKGPATSTLASQSIVVSPDPTSNDQQQMVQNFTLPAADIAIPIAYPLSVDESGAPTDIVRVNRHLVIVCLRDSTKDDAESLITCGVSRDRSGVTGVQAYDVRLATKNIPSGLRPNAAVYGFGALLLPSGARPVERKLSLADWNKVSGQPIPDGVNLLDILEQNFTLQKASSNEPNKLVMFDSNQGGGGNDNGEGRPDSTNCMSSEVKSSDPFLKGTVLDPDDKPAPYYELEIKAAWVTSSSAGWYANFGWGGGGYDAGTYSIWTDKNGEFTLCAGVFSPQNPIDLSVPVPGDARSVLVAVVKPEQEGRKDVATTFLFKADQNGSTTYKDCIAAGLLTIDTSGGGKQGDASGGGKQGGTSTQAVAPPCEVSLKAMRPQIEGNVQTPLAAPVQFPSLEVRSVSPDPNNLMTSHFFDMRPREDGWFGLASNLPSPRSYQVKVRPPVCTPEVAGSCAYKDLASTTALFTSGADLAGNGRLQWSGGGGASKTITLPASNFVGVLMDSDRNPLSETHVELSCAPSLPGSGASTCSPTEFDTNWPDGSFATYLTDGTYSMQLYGKQDGVDTGYIVEASGGVVTRVGYAPPTQGEICGRLTNVSCTLPLEILTAAPNFNLMVKDDDGQPVESARVNINEVSVTSGGGCQGSCWTFMGVAGRPTGSDNKQWDTGIPGVVGFSLSAGKIYEVNVDPPSDGSSDTVSTKVLFKTVATGSGGVAFYRCAKWPESGATRQTNPCDKGFVGDDPPGSDDVLSTDTTGGVTRFLITMASSNFRGVLCRPGNSGCTTVGNAYVGLQQWISTGGGGGYWGPANDSFGAPVNESGSFALSFTRSGAYKFFLNQPWVYDRVAGKGGADTSLSNTEVIRYIEVSVGGSVTVSRATITGTKVNDSVISPNGSGRYELRYAVPTLSGLVVDPNDAVSNRGGAATDVEVQTETNSPTCRECRYPYTNARTDAQGRFAVNLPAGRYIVKARPSGNSTGLTAREIKIRLQDCDQSDGGGLPEIYDYSAPDCGANPSPQALALNNEGRLVFTLGGANFSGTLYNPVTSLPVAWSGYQTEKWTTNPGAGGSGYWQWLNSWANTNQSGAFASNFDSAGRYRVTFQTPGNATDLSAAQVVLNVAKAEASNDMVVTPDVDASGGSSVISSAGNGKWQVYLRLPNASGYVTDPTGNTRIQGAWINLQKWYDAGSQMCPQSGCWQWQNDVSGTTTRWSNTPSEKGTFALNLPTGHWRLQVNSPVATYTTRELDVLVDASGTLCLAPSSVATCVGRAAIARGAFEIRLSPPNFSGYVVTETYAGADSGADPGAEFTGAEKKVSRWSQVRFETWTNDYGNGYWGWTNIWLNTNESGYFSSNLKTNGAYKVTFDPNWQLNEFASVSRYVAVCDDGAKVKLVTEGIAKAWTCSDSNKASMDSTIAKSIVLNGANIKGVVRDGTAGSAALGDAWISVQTCTDAPWGGESCSWVRGTNTPNTGASAGTFGFRIDNDLAEPAKYKFEVNPPWYSTSGLVRKTLDVWVGNFDSDSSTSEYCLKQPTAGKCGTDNEDAQDASKTWSITLTAGNLAGKVVVPHADCSVSSTCLGVANASLQVEKWDALPWSVSNYGWMWKPIWANSTGDWQASSPTNGRFGLNLDSEGVYRVTVNPSWNNPDSYTRSVYIVTVNGSGDWCITTGVSPNSFDNRAPNPMDGELASDGVSTRPTGCSNFGRDNNGDDVVDGFTAELSGSNLTGVLYDSTTDLAAPTDAQRVPYSWVSLQKKETRKYCWGAGADQCQEWLEWQWVGNSSTAGGTNAGMFGLSVVEPGDYRLEFNPAWSNTNAQTQFRLEFTVTSTSLCKAGNTSPSNCTVSLPSPAVAGGGGTYRIKYPAPNFSGTLYDKTYDSNPSADNSSKKVGGAWLSVMRADNGQWVGGASTIWNGSDKGKFAMRLDSDTTYRVEVNPPWNAPESGLRKTMVVVVGDEGNVDKVVLGQDPAGPNVLCGGGSPACAASLALYLANENVNGIVYYPKSGAATPMPWASANAFKCDVSTWADESGSVDPGSCGNWAGWSNSNYDGSIRFGFDADGVYRITLWPNYGLYSASPLEVEVRIAGGTMTGWRYRGESDLAPSAFAPDFGHRKPNVTVTVTGISDARFVQIARCADGSETGAPGQCNSPTVVQRTETVYDGGWKIAVSLDPGVYRFSVVRKSSDGTTRPTEVVQVTGEHTGNAPLAVTLAL